ncbi:hypothetical protein LJC27_07365, partial [Christensenellaceae bacterium OttesenSCG-928-M15]|nr:hypothetical protein [Christensenellaceae bacterium OttesenSCG-928-M15]
EDEIISTVGFDDNHEPYFIVIDNNTLHEVNGGDLYIYNREGISDNIYDENSPEMEDDWDDYTFSSISQIRKSYIRGAVVSILDACEKLIGLVPDSQLLEEMLKPHLRSMPEPIINDEEWAYAMYLWENGGNEPLQYNSEITLSEQQMTKVLQAVAGFYNEYSETANYNMVPEIRALLQRWLKVKGITSQEELDYAYYLYDNWDLVKKELGWG